MRPLGRMGRIGLILVGAVLCMAAAAPAFARPRVLVPATKPLEVKVVPDAARLWVSVVNVPRVGARARVQLVVPPALRRRIDTASGPRAFRGNRVTRVRFRVTRGPLPEGTFDGLVVVRSAGRTVDRVPIRIVVSASVPTEKPQPKPAVKALKLTIHRSAPLAEKVDVSCGTDEVDACHLLLRPPPKDGTLDLSEVPKDETLGILSGSEDRYLLVEWNGAVTDVGGRTTALGLNVSGDVGPGTYSGPVDLLPEDPDNDAVDMTVVVTDAWGWVVVTLAIGVGGAFFIRRWNGLGRKVSHLKSDAATAYDAFACGNPNGQVDAVGGYSIGQAREGASKALTAQLRDLDSLLAIELSEDDPAYKAAVANVEAMEMAAATWCAFRSDLENLRLALAPGPATVGRPPAVLDDDGALLGTPKRPRWWEDAEALAEPPDVVQLSFAELAETRARVKKATALAKSWGPLTQLLWELDRRIVLIEQKCGPSLDDAQRKTLTSAKMGVSEARWELWFAADADDLERRTSKSDLAAAERDVARLSDCLLPGVVQPPTHQIRRLSPFTGDGVTSRLLAWLSGMAEVADLSAGRDPAEVIAVERVKRRLFNAIVLWLLVGALLFAGLKELYLDDAVFGTWPDYLGALLWGLGATVTVDTVSSAIDKFRAGRTRAGA